jgi:hypothetical protein
MLPGSAAAEGASFEAEAEDAVSSSDCSARSAVLAGGVDRRLGVAEARDRLAGVELGVDRRSGAAAATGGAPGDVPAAGGTAVSSVTTASVSSTPDAAEAGGSAPSLVTAAGRDVPDPREARYAPPPAAATHEAARRPNRTGLDTMCLNLLRYSVEQ